MWRLTKVNMILERRNQLEKTVCECTSSLCLNSLDRKQKYFTHLGTSPIIIKACNPRNALLRRIMIIYASWISQLSNIFTKQGVSEFLGADATTPAKAVFSSCSLSVTHTNLIQLFLITCTLIRPAQQYYALHQNPRKQKKVPRCL